MEPSLSEINVSCLLCEQTFDAIDKLDEHLNAHFPQPVASQSQICDLCGRGMRSSLELHQHYKRFHEAHVAATDGHFHCQLCDKVFLLQDHLNVHVKIEHSSDGYRPDDKIPEWKQNNDRCIDLTTDYRLDPILCPPPKKKYPPRSPFFNPNLWLCTDNSFL
ncbi:uncharacterized zinc finger protein CG12744 [Drosophila takahashii]|uniref:uncharacterized zinc finger protein CG12744 n=1 Tax=Drosophila takahashii TaxID=29030 RepID=UPI001CF8694E|nr:uncharacterized zinc finger protein CG12744 [Drosophila takahashii]